MEEGDFGFDINSPLLIQSILEIDHFFGVFEIFVIPYQTKLCLLRVADPNSR